MKPRIGHLTRPPEPFTGRFADPPPQIPASHAPPRRQPSPGTGFGSAAAAYQRGRPDYPADLVSWLIGDAARIADIGAGTGKLTGTLLALGRDVTAVDPDPRMLAALQAEHPAARTATGRGEEIPLPDHSVDALTFGQSWHWVDPPAASREAARVLAPGGTLGLIWNIRDESEPWVAELSTIMTASPAEAMIAEDRVGVAAPFPTLERRSRHWVRTMTIGELRDMISSRSYVIAAPPEERHRILDRATRLAERVAGHAGTIDLPYRTDAFRTAVPA